jgi:hypothetical protein
MRWSIVWTRTRVQTVDVRSGSVGTERCLRRSLSRAQFGEKFTMVTEGIQRSA